MKRLFLSLGFIALFGGMIFGQDGELQQKREKKIAAYRVAVFTEVLNLTTEEAQGFWPIFNEYQSNREYIQKQLKPTKQLDGMSESEVEQYIKDYFELKQKEIDLEKDLVSKLRKVLPARKIAKLPVAEREFREQLVKKLQENRERRMERRPGRN